MKEKYQTYTLEELLDDESFLAYLKHGKHSEEWDVLLRDDSVLKKKAEEAKKIIKILSNSGDELSENEILNIWQKIDRYDDVLCKRGNRRIYYMFLRYAAVFILLAALGSATWFYYLKTGQPGTYQFSESYTPPNDGDTRLFLHNGKEITVTQDQSTVEITESGEIVINHEKVMDTRQAKPGKSAVMNEVVVPYGKKTRLVLADGTKVWLNAGSRMAFPSEFTGKTRDVYLEGEAFFQVAHSESQPFSVHVRDIDVRVLGTTFNISAYRGEPQIETVLLQGKVALTDHSDARSSRKETQLVPGQKATFHNDNRKFEVEIVTDTDLYTAWTYGWYLFSYESLQSVLRKMTRYYNVEFECDSQFSGAELISGKLDLKDSLGQVLTALADVARFEYRIDDNTVHIYKPIGKMPMRK